MKKFGSPNDSLITNDIIIKPSEEIIVYVILDSSSDISAFGFDLAFPSECIEFVGLEKTEYYQNFYQIGAHKASRGLLRVGGYKKKPYINRKSGFLGALIALVFRVIGGSKTEESYSFSFIRTYDDIQNASIRNGVILRKAVEENFRNRKPAKKRIVVIQKPVSNPDRQNQKFC